MTEFARSAHRDLADLRALEEQAERTNPISGSGATPSMGLSQFRGGRKHKKAKAAEDSEAHAQGVHLGKHLHSLHGMGYYKDFVEGMGAAGGAETGAYEGEGKLQGGFWGALASAAIPIISSLFGKGQMTKEAHDELMAVMKPKEAKKARKGKGKLVITHGDDASEASEPEMKGGASMERMVGAGASDGRKRRAEVVRRVMKEKGMKMIEASKYVKEHGLY